MHSASEMTTQSSPKQRRHQITSFSVTDILGSGEPCDPAATTGDDTACQQQADPEMTSVSPLTHNAMHNTVRDGSDSLHWTQMLQRHPTCE